MPGLPQAARAGGAYATARIGVPLTHVGDQVVPIEIRIEVFSAAMNPAFAT
jgi:hypothetical protein